MRMNGKLAAQEVSAAQRLDALNLFEVGPAGVRNKGKTMHDQDSEMETAGKGFVVKSSDGTRYRIQVNDAGALFTTAV